MYKAITLPKAKRDPKLTEGLCKCRPVCKSRRREWKGQLQMTSDELLLERKPVPECFRRRPTEVYPNGPCPLFGRSKNLTIKELYTDRKPDVVRICQAPLDVVVETPYLDFMAEDLKLEALPLRMCTRCTFCDCGGVCCHCSKSNYEPADAERASRRREHMREFDSRVRNNPVTRNVYN